MKAAPEYFHFLLSINLTFCSEPGYSNRIDISDKNTTLSSQENKHLRILHTFILLPCLHIPDFRTQALIRSGFLRHLACLAIPIISIGSQG